MTFRSFALSNKELCRDIDIAKTRTALLRLFNQIIKVHQ